MAIQSLPYCLRLLKRRPYSVHELEQAMQRKGIEAEERTQTLSQLAELDLVSDLRFARAWVHTRDRLMPRGAQLLRQELIQKGISKDIVQQVLAERAEEAAEEESEQPSEEELARRIVQGKERLYANLDPEVRYRRLMALLQRRGFSYDVIRRILNP